jgi:Avirulence protein
MYEKYCSRYFIKKNTNRFGSRQDEYLEHVDEVVKTTSENFCNAVDVGDDLTQIFHTTLDYLGERRHAIAVQHAHEKADLFGKKRVDASDVFMMYTTLNEVYHEYNNILLPKIQKYLRNIPRTFREFKETEAKVAGKSCMAKRTSTDIAILTAEKQAEFTIDFTRENYERLCDICSIIPRDESQNIITCFNSLITQDIMAIIKQKSPIDYKRFKMIYVIQDIYEDFPGKKSDWIVVTPRCEIQGKMYALTQYLTWAHRTYQDDPIDYMTARKDPTVIALLHQDVFLVKDTLQDIANIFKQAIEWKSGETQELINLVGLINYLLAHTMPFKRGSAAIAEWLEMAIYRYHGLELQYDTKYSINMEALTLPLDEFIDKYPAMIKLEPIDVTHDLSPK